MHKVGESNALLETKKPSRSYNGSKWEEAVFESIGRS